MGQNDQLGDLQLAIMRVLWDHGESSVIDVYEALRDTRGIAPTTVSTMLVGLEKRGVVVRRREGRKFFYKPVVGESETKRRLVDELVDRVFLGDTRALLSHLVGESGVSAEELDLLRKQIEERRAQGDQADA